MSAGMCFMCGGWVYVCVSLCPLSLAATLCRLHCIALHYFLYRVLVTNVYMHARACVHIHTYMCACVWVCGCVGVWV